MDFLKKKTSYDANGFDSEGYNRLGYDRMGYNREGYDINGYNREGYNAQGIYKLTGRDKDGYDEFGYNSDGINREGYSKDGFNADGYDKDGYDREGYDREGYNRDGFNKAGINRDGYDQDGYNADGFNKSGYNRDGFNKEGFDRDGYDKKGFNKEGYNRSGFDVKGYDRDGFNRDGYNKEGFDRKGYDKKGYDRDGYDREGYDKKGFDIEGYSRDGYDKKGYDREGYNKDGFNKEGYNREGYDKKGFNKEGLDAEGYNKKGFNAEGFNREGFDKNGFDKEGYDADGFNAVGIDREGFNVEGYDSEGYDHEGYNRKGFNRTGISKLGFKQEEFDSEGYHKITGFDVWGYSRYGFNVNGINKHTGRDRLGFDADGLDENGFNIWGFNLDTQKDIRGNDIESYEDNPKMTEEMCSEFETLYYQYMAGKMDVAIKLANCYVYGRGTVRDYKKTLRILLDVAIEYHNLEAIRELADHFYIGDIIGVNLPLSTYFRDIFDNNELETINQYKVRQALEFQKPVNTGDKIYKEEQEHLEKVIRCLDEQIRREEAAIGSLDNDTSWMDFDQLQYWREQKARNIEAGKRVEEYEIIRRRPYYARMDASTSSGKETFYIGEYAYMDWNNPSCQILSVWSEVGKKYRESSKTQFSINGHRYDVKLRRKIDIASGHLVGYYDEYSEGSEAAKADITNPYLLKILEEKRGEKNITNIIRSIQLNQNDIIEADFKANIVVQGCAGSGKTMILLHRLANMKYNQPKYDWSKVKIITPNKDFTLFIDELSRNLRIDEIEKITLQEYYLQLLQKYDNQFPERGTNGVVNHFNIGNERQKLRDETEIEKSILEIVYSEEFRSRIATLIENSKEEIQNFRDSMDVLYMNLQTILEEFECKLPKRLPNYNFYLYLKVLAAYLSFGAIRNSENMLCIDEGQDICEQQYILLYEVNGEKTCLNIYGDLAQRIPQNVSISSWSNLKKMLHASYYELNENYRNSENIINYYGKVLKINNGSFGLKTKDVEQFDEADLDILLKMQLLLGNRTVVISNSENSVPANVLSLCRSGKISENRISIMTVKQVKGLEFDTAFVFDDGMDKNEKYIAYTRALSELYVSSKVAGSKIKALDIKNEDEEETREKRPSKSRSSKAEKKEYPEFRFDEDVTFYDQTVLFEDDNIYLTLGIPEIQQNCFTVKMALRIPVGFVSDVKIDVVDLCMDSGSVPFVPEIEFGSIPVFVPYGDTELEQIVSFSIPLSKLTESIIEAIENESEYFEYSFALNISYEDSDGDIIEDTTDIFSVDVFGEFIEDEEQDDPDDEDDDDEVEEEYTSITELDEVNDRDVLIVVRKGWSNDFCFVVERFDGQMARGTQYLNGKEYKASSYNRYHHEFALYDGPSLKKIEDQYE